MSLYILDTGLSTDELVRDLGEVFPIDVRDEPKERVTYCDTFDWRLFKAGLTLTTSRIGKQARVALTTGDGRVLDSIVHRAPSFASDLTPSPLPEIVEPVAKHRRLLPRARGEWKGTFISIVNEDGKTIGRLRIRVGKALLPDGGGEIPLAPRIEFLPLKGYRVEERKVTSFLKERMKVKREKRAEQAAIYRAVHQTPCDYSSSFSLELDPGMAAAEAAKQVHLVLLKTVLSNREGVTRDWDAEFLHDFRVAVRRTRSALTQLRGVFPEAATEYFKGEFRWLGSKTGPARDIDVYLLKIPAYRAALYPAARKDLQPLVKLLEEKKKVELGRLRRCLRSKRFHRLLEDWQAFLETPDTQDSALPHARRPIREVASERIWKALTKVRKRGGEIGQFTPAENLHRLRIDCKKLRYLITFFQSLYPPEALEPLIAELKRLQDHLGDFNDLQVQREALRRFAEEMMAAKSAPPTTLLAMGQLMGQLEGKQNKEREAFQDHFSRFTRTRTLKRFRGLFGPGPSGSPKPGTGRKNR